MKFELFNPALRVPEIILFENANFEGREFRTNLLLVNDVGKLTTIKTPDKVTTFVQHTPDYALSQIIFSTWNLNDNISSIIVISGIWQFIKM